MNYHFKRSTYFPILVIVTAIVFGNSGVTASELKMLGEPWSTSRATPQSKTPTTLTLVAASVAEDISYSYGDPTIAEQVHLEEINRARMDPSAEAILHGVDLNEGLAPGTISSDPVQPVVFNAKLLAAARNHSQDMLDNNYFSHYSQDNSSPGDRVTAQDYNWQSVGENLALRAYSYSVDEVANSILMHADLYIDEDYDGRGHRINIFASSHKEVGIGLRSGPFTFGDFTYQYTFMLTCDFATAWDYNESFVLGVVFDDDGDSVYEAGEGVANITIQLLDGDTLVAETTTATAGGFGIPVANGTYTIRAAENDTNYVEKTVTINGFNKKVDFLMSEFVEHGISGDFDGDLDSDLADVIVGLQLFAGNAPGNISANGDTDGDGKIGFSDVLSVMRAIAE